MSRYSVPVAGRTFTPEERARSHESQRARSDRALWANVRIVGECWEWTASRQTPRAAHHRGYGMLHRNGRLVYAHRRAYELTTGPIPAGMHVLHHCDNPPCINPAHLFVGTQADNARDMAAKGRWRNQTSPPLTPVELCWLCRRREAGVNVTLDGAIRNVCDTCWQRGEEGIRIPLDMTEDDDA